MMLDITFTPPLCPSIFSEEKMRDVSDPSPSIETRGRFSRVRDCNIKAQEWHGDKNRHFTARLKDAKDNLVKDPAD